MVLYPILRKIYMHTKSDGEFRYMAFRMIGLMNYQAIYMIVAGIPFQLLRHVIDMLSKLDGNLYFFASDENSIGYPSPQSMMRAFVSHPGRVISIPSIWNMFQEIISAISRFCSTVGSCPVHMPQ